MSRQAIHDALFAIGSTVTWGDGDTFLASSKRLRNYSDCADQPAFFQVAHDEDYQQVTGLPYRKKLTLKWVVYYNVAADPQVDGVDVGNLILDAVEASLKPTFTPGQPYTDRCTLGGLAHHVFIEGGVFRDGGDLDGQGILVIPISVLVP